MLTSPFIIPGLLLVGALITYLLYVFQPRFADFVPAVVSAWALVLWAVMGRGLPETIVYGDSHQPTWLPGWRWVFDETIWPLLGVLLLFIFALFVFRLGLMTSAVQAARQDWRLRRGQWQSVILLCLSAVGVMVLGSATMMTFLMAWTLLALLWSFFLIAAVTERPQLQGIALRFFWMLVPLLFGGIVAATQPPGADLLDFNNWSDIAVVAVLLTVMAQMGILPFIGWRPRNEPVASDAGAVLQLMPALLGAGLLARLLATGHFSSSIALLLTLMTLLSIMQGIRRIWMYGQTSSRLAADLALALTSLAFLAGIWSGTTALNAAARLFVFSTTIFYFLDHLPLVRARWWRAAAPALAVLAIAGLPLTAGFVTVTSVYDSWLINNRFVFILALLALWLPLLTALLVNVRRQSTLSVEPAGNQIDILLMEAGQILTALGLIVVFGRELDQIHLLTWLILFVTGIGTYLLSRFTGETKHIVATVNSAFKPSQQQLSRAWRVTGRFGAQVVTILSESAHILEGEQGLLWLAAFLALLIVALVL